MFARVFALLPLALLASANIAARQTNSCNGGTEACCDQAFSQTVPDLGVLGIVDLILDAALEAGVTCSGISVTTCNQQTLCCDQDQSDAGLINISCNNINGL